MALSQHDLLRLLESLRSADGLELVRSVAERMLQELIEAEATARIGAEWNEHTDARTALRNGHREKTLTTQAGDLGLGIPKLRSGSFFPVLLERRRRIDQALFAVVMEAYVHGVSTRSVDDLVKALGSDTGISKSSTFADGLVLPFVRWGHPGVPGVAIQELPVVACFASPPGAPRRLGRQLGRANKSLSRAMPTRSSVVRTEQTSTSGA